MTNRIIPPPPEGLGDEDALAIAMMLLATGRAVDPRHWVEEIAAQADMDSFAGIG